MDINPIPYDLLLNCLKREAPLKELEDTIFNINKNILRLSEDDLIKRLDIKNTDLLSIDKSPINISFLELEREILEFLNKVLARDPNLSKFHIQIDQFQEDMVCMDMSCHRLEAKGDPSHKDLLFEGLSEYIELDLPMFNANIFYLKDESIVLRLPLSLNLLKQKNIIREFQLEKNRLFKDRSKQKEVILNILNVYYKRGNKAKNKTDSKAFENLIIDLISILSLSIDEDSQIKALSRNMVENKFLFYIKALSRNLTSPHTVLKSLVDKKWRESGFFKESRFIAENGSVKILLDPSFLTIDKEKVLNNIYLNNYNINLVEENKQLYFIDSPATRSFLINQINTEILYLHSGDFSTKLLKKLSPPVIDNMSFSINDNTNNRAWVNLL